MTQTYENACAKTALAMLQVLSPDEPVMEILSDMISSLWDDYPDGLAWFEALVADLALEA